MVLGLLMEEPRVPKHMMRAAKGGAPRGLFVGGLLLLASISVAACGRESAGEGGRVASSLCDTAPGPRLVAPRLERRWLRPVGAGQGIQVNKGVVNVYGDSNTGVVMELNHRLVPTGWVGYFVTGGQTVVQHPVGIAYAPGLPTFIGSGDGPILVIDWAVFRDAGTLDGAILRTVEETETPDVYKGSRPEYVRLGSEWYVATSDFALSAVDDVAELRLMDPLALSHAETTGDPGVIVHRLPVSSYIQSLHWREDIQQLVLVQNLNSRAEGWKLTFLDLEVAIETGSGLSGAVTQTLCFPYESELEGYAHLADGRDLMVTATGDLFVTADFLASPETPVSTPGR